MFSGSTWVKAALPLALWAVALSPAHAASLTTTEYTVTYDDSTVFGGISFNGGGDADRFFGWNGPFTGSTGNDPVLVAGPGASLDIDLPEFTLTANAGYTLSDLSFESGGSLFRMPDDRRRSVALPPDSQTFASADLPLGLTASFEGPDFAIGTWTVKGRADMAPYTSLAFSGGKLMLNGGDRGYIFVGKTEGAKFGFNVAAIPEPETWGLALAGLALLPMLRRRSAKV